MGLFDAQCAISALSLFDARLVLVRLGPEGWTPVAPPLTGYYDGYGGVGLDGERTGSADRLLENALLMALDDLQGRSVLRSAHATKLPMQRFAKLMTELADARPSGSLTVEGEPLAYSLFEPTVFDAAAAEIAESSDPTLASLRSAALAELSVAELATRAFGVTAAGGLREPARTLFDMLLDAEALLLRPHLVAVLQVSEWLRRFGSWDGAGLVRTDRGAQYEWQEKLGLFDAAVTRLAPHHHVVAAVRALREEFLGERRYELREELDGLQNLGGALRAGETRRAPGMPALVSTADVMKALRALNAGGQLTEADCDSGFQPRTPGTCGAPARGICRACWGADGSTDVFEDSYAAVEAALAKLDPSSFTKLVTLLEGELSEATSEILSAGDGSVRVDPGLSHEARSFLTATEPDGAAADGDHVIAVTGVGELRYLVAKGRALAVSSGDLVAAGGVLAPGTPNLHATLHIFGSQSAMQRFVALVKAQLATVAPEIDARSVELLVRRSLIGFVRIQTANDARFRVGQRVAIEAFQEEIARLLGSGAEPPFADAVFVGLSSAAASDP